MNTTWLEAGWEHMTLKTYKWINEKCMGVNAILLNNSENFEYIFLIYYTSLGKSANVSMVPAQACYQQQPSFLGGKKTLQCAASL
jgi:hypothetical protein